MAAVAVIHTKIDWILPLRNPPNADLPLMNTQERSVRFPFGCAA